MVRCPSTMNAERHDFEMTGVQAERDKSFFILIDHCNQMKREERRSRIVTCVLFLVLSVSFFWYTQTHRSLDCKLSKNDLEQSASSQPDLESRPAAHLTEIILRIASEVWNSTGQ
ncbi:hypothetical protein GJAV_G00030470 [Gymnothorax javanicus]|nr:hypothetical protein GJAV_G00030470 [Gymnothorax javanicus]